jgi:DNA polymerase III alpha subunit
MSYDEYGQQFLTEDELVGLIHKNLELDISKVLLERPGQFNATNKRLYAGYPNIARYIEPTGSIEEFDIKNQAQWDMPQSYKDFDIMAWLMAQVDTDEQIDRVAEELYLYDDRDLIPLLQFLKYTIDMFRKNKIVWGVGRGSSVSSYVLFLIGVHKIDSMLYDLDITEFLR